jgi:hypothetical protein
MEETPENGKESLHSAHANGMNECTTFVLQRHNILGGGGGFLISTRNKNAKT